MCHQSLTFDSDVSEFAAASLLVKTAAAAARAAADLSILNAAHVPKLFHTGARCITLERNHTPLPGRPEATTVTR